MFHSFLIFSTVIFLFVFRNWQLYCNCSLNRLAKILFCDVKVSLSESVFGWRNWLIKGDKLFSTATENQLEYHCKPCIS